MDCPSCRQVFDWYYNGPIENDPDRPQLVLSYLPITINTTACTSFYALGTSLLLLGFLQRILYMHNFALLAAQITLVGTCARKGRKQGC